MFKRVATAVTVLIFAGVVVVGCGSKGKYADEKELLKNMTKSIESLTAALDKVTSGKEAAKAFNDFADSMKGYKAAMDKMKKKYPKMKDAPKELEAEVKAFENATKKMMPVMFKMVKYQKDPDVAAAMKNMQKVMQ